MKTLAVLLAVCAPLAAQKTTVYVITDAEGVAGICRQDQTDNKNPELRQLLTAEVNAAADGFFTGGAEEVIIWDGHGGSATLSAATIYPRARLVIGDPGPTMLFERRFSALAFVGQHARANTSAAVMAHSYSSLGYQYFLINGKPAGEIEAMAALAGEFGTPVIFLSGDRAAVADLRAIVPGAETAEVKEGLSYYACVTLSGPAARDAIQLAAQRAMKKIGIVRPYRIPGPVTIQVERTTRSTLPPGAGDQVDARTTRYTGKDFTEAWRRYRGR
ncbi:MAG: M55 family metallopeptidase [Bryobacteraceae bacterium]